MAVAKYSLVNGIPYKVRHLKVDGRIWEAAKNPADYEKAMNCIRNKKYKNKVIGQAAYDYLAFNLFVDKISRIMFEREV